MKVNSKWRKMDEMEQHIMYQSVRNAYIFLLISSFILVIYDFIQTGKLGVMFFLFTIAGVIQSVSSLYLDKKMSRDAE